MSTKLKKHITAFIAALALLVPMIVPATSLAATCSNLQKGVNSGIDSATGNNGNIGCGTTQTISSGIGPIASTVVNILSIIVGALAVIMIIYAAVRYVASGGESGSVSSAKNSLIYAIVGLILVALAQVIVHLVLNTGANISNNISGTLPHLRHLL